MVHINIGTLQWKRTLVRTLSCNLLITEYDIKHGKAVEVLLRNSAIKFLSGLHKQTDFCLSVCLSA